MGVRLSRNERKHTAVAQLKLLDSLCIWGVGNLVVLDFIFILACTLWNLYHFFIAGDCGADVPGLKGVYNPGSPSDLWAAGRHVGPAGLGAPL